MPFDDALLKNVKKEMPGDKRKSMFVGETRKRASKSELGFHKTFGSIATTTQEYVIVSNQSPPVENEEELMDVKTIELSTNHPGTLLKNLHPRIAPKNKGTEQAREKVKNISQRLKHSQQVQESMQCNCQTEIAGDHLDTCATMIILNTQKVKLQTMGSLAVPNNDNDDDKFLQAHSILIHDSISVDCSSEEQESEKLTQKQLNSLSDELTANLCILVEEQKENRQIHHRQSGNVVSPPGRLVLENQNTVTHRLLLKNSESPHATDTQTLQKSPKISNAESLRNKHSSTEEINLTIGQPYVEVTRSFNKLKDEIMTRSGLHQPQQSQEQMSDEYKHQMHNLLQIAAIAKTPSYQSCSPEHKDGCLCSQSDEPNNVTMYAEQTSPKRSSFFESLMREQQRRSATNPMYVKAQKEPTHKRQRKAADGRMIETQQSPFQRISAPIPSGSEDQFITDHEKQQQKMQIKQIMKEVQVSQQAQQALYKKPSAKALIMKQCLATNDLLNRHKKQRLNPVVGQRASLSSRIGTLENNRKLQQLGFRDPMLNMISSIHAYDESDGAKSTLYGFKARKRSCMQYPSSQSINTDLTSVHPVPNQTLPGIRADQSEPMRSSIYKVSKAPVILASKITTTTMSTFDSSKEKSSLHQSKDRSKNDIRNRKISKQTRQPLTDFGGLVEIIETMNSGLTTKNYGTKEQNSLAASLSSPKWRKGKKPTHNADLSDLDKDKPIIFVHDSIEKRKRSHGVVQQSTEMPRTFGVSGGSVVVSKVNQAIRRKRVIQQPPQTGEQDKRGGAQNKSVNVPSRLMTQMSVRRSGLSSCLTGGQMTENQGQSSTVQMIELELPNLQIDESRISPQRVQVMSRDLEHQMNLINLQNLSGSGYRRMSNKSSMEKLMGMSDNKNRTNAEIQASFFERKSVDASDMQSEAEILRGMVATMRGSNEFAKKLSLSQQSDVEKLVNNIQAGENAVQSTPGLLQMATAAVATSPLDKETEPLKDLHEKQLNDAIQHVKTPKDLIQKLWHMSLQAKEQNTISEDFCLKSGSAAIHDEHPLHQKMQYFDNLKQRDAQLKMLNSQIQKLKVRDVKEQTWYRKQLNAAKPRVRTQMQMKKSKNNKDVEVMQQVIESEEVIQDRDVHTQMRKFSEIDSPKKSRAAISRLGAQQSHLQKSPPTKVQTKVLISSENPQMPMKEEPVAVEATVAIAEEHSKSNSPTKPSPKKDTKQKSKNVTIMMNIGRNTLQNHPSNRKQSHITTTTIGLPPQTNQTEMEQLINQEVFIASNLLLSPNSNEMETQICAEPPSEDGNNSETAIIATVVIKDEIPTSTTGQVKQKIEMEEKPSYMSLRQYQLENADLDDTGHGQDPNHGNKGFMSTVKRRSVHGHVGPRKTPVMSLSSNTNEPHVESQTETPYELTQPAQP